MSPFDLRANFSTCPIRQGALRKTYGTGASKCDLNQSPSTVLWRQKATKSFCTNEIRGHCGAAKYSLFFCWPCCGKPTLSYSVQVLVGPPDGHSMLPEATKLGLGISLFCGMDTTAENKPRTKCVSPGHESALVPILLTPAALGFFDQSSDPDKDDCTDESHNNRTNHASSLPQAE